MNEMSPMEFFHKANSAERYAKKLEKLSDFDRRVIKAAKRISMLDPRKDGVVTYGDFNNWTIKNFDELMVLGKFAYAVSKTPTAMKEIQRDKGLAAKDLVQTIEGHRMNLKEISLEKCDFRIFHSTAWLIMIFLDLVNKRLKLEHEMEIERHEKTFKYRFEKIMRKLFFYLMIGAAIAGIVESVSSGRSISYYDMAPVRR
jgi:hypothetical protein